MAPCGEGEGGHDLDTSALRAEQIAFHPVEDESGALSRPKV
jgi:hypothetical protein